MKREDMVFGGGGGVESERSSTVAKRPDVAGFARDLELLRKETYAAIGEEDLQHLKKIEWWGRIFSFLGYATAWIIPNPITALFIALGQNTRWLFAHHILHKGYDKVPNVPYRYTSKGFAQGYRRYIDWFDWMRPDGWDYEHNILHHYHTSENTDPDVVERHLEYLRKMPVPQFLKRIFVYFAGCTWKFLYYAPNTLSCIDPDTKERLKHENIIFVNWTNIFDFRRKHVRQLWTDCYFPYFTWNFIAIPALFLPLGQTAALFVLINKIIAEAINNFHSFMVVGPNHTADDLYRFDFHYKNKDEFYVTQVMSSVNYVCGGDVNDYLNVWLNYQIEHHLFPDLPMLKYQQVQPKVKALCEKHGLPYKQEHVWTRYNRMVDICVGKTSMKQVGSFEELIERESGEQESVAAAA